MPSLDIIIPAFNAEHCLHRTLEAIFGQTVSAELVSGVIVVNNKSTDRTGEVIGQWAASRVRRIDYNDRQGRSAAINAGAAASSADYLLILDADCRLQGRNGLQIVAQAIAAGVDAGFGYATGTSAGFWGRYHRQLAADRIAAGWQGWTTQCCFVRRELFAAAGGFPEDYTHYGFEDRDFICRLRALPAPPVLQSLPDLQASHDDVTTAADICRKMYLSGRYSSGIFARNFPDAYRATMYARVDVDTAARYMVALLRLLRPLQAVFVRIADYLANRHNTPLAIGRPFVRLCSALSYFQGTVDRAAE